MIQKIKYLIILAFILVSCKISSGNDTNDLMRIISPKENHNYYEDELIFFTTNVDSNEIQWNSNIDGYLGKGNNIHLFLTEGDHEIVCSIGDYKKNLTISIKKHSLEKGTSVNYFLNDKSQVFLYPGIYSPIVCCLNNSEKSLYLQKKDNSDSGLLKDLQIENEIRTKKISGNDSRNSIANEYCIGDKKSFYIIKTNNQFDEPYQKECICIDIGKHYSVWIPIDDSYDLKLIKECTKTFDDFLYERLSTIWGDWADVDSDRKIALLFSSTINEESYAIGFYNTNDLFNNEQNSYSNQMDVLYLGIPVSESYGSYSVSSITATIAHELTHAINFNQKTYKKILSGEDNIAQEEVFIDEAFSHLSENLCGFGISGGNIEFVKYYLKNSSDYSLCGKSRFGESDTAGQRGAMLMFMSWLFWKKGGLLWNEDNPIEVIDNGGISFLRELVKSECSSWENIGDVFGKPISQLFIEFVNDINMQQFNPISYVLDPVTSENVIISLAMPEIQSSFLSVNKSIFEKSDYLQWSLTKTDSLIVYAEEIYEIETENRENFVLSLIKIE